MSCLTFVLSCSFGLMLLGTSVAQASQVLEKWSEWIARLRRGTELLQEPRAGVSVQCESGCGARAGGAGMHPCTPASAPPLLFFFSAASLCSSPMNNLPYCLG